jgi:predicted ATPase
MDHPHDEPRHVIESFEFKGGYVDRVQLDFHARHNDIIGGRGSGKSTIVEALRKTFGCPVPAPFAKERASRVKGTLTNATMIARIRTDHGSRYKVTCTTGRDPVVTDDKDQVVPVSLDSELFQIELYGQNELEYIATDAASQLALLDKFDGPKARVRAEQIRHTKTKAREMGRTIAAHDKEIAAEREVVAEIATIQAAVAERALPPGMGADELQRGTTHRSLRGRERAVFDQLLGDVPEVRARIESLSSDLERLLSGVVEPALIDGPNGAELGRLAQLTTAATKEARARLASASAVLVGLHESIVVERQALDVVHAKQDTAFSALAAEHAEHQAALAERARLETRLIELLARSRKLDERLRERAHLREAFDKLVAELRRLTGGLSETRTGSSHQITTLLEGELRVSVKPAADTTAYEAFLVEALKGSGAHTKLIGEIAASIRPDDLSALILADDLEPIIAIDTATTADKPARARKIVDWLRDGGHAYEIAAFILDDIPLIELKTPAMYKASGEVSIGQRCTCILPIVMLLGTGPLIIDQPEDNLDNAFIFDVLVKSIAFKKCTRQLIFVTHNPNIPVLGDAERVFALESDGSRGVLAHVGDVDALRGVVERWLEGGSEAFRRRSERYGHRLAP